MVVTLLVATCGFTSAAAGASPSVASPVVGAAATPGGGGWWTVTAQGVVTPRGTAPDLGDMAGSSLNQPIVGMAATPDGGGYWLVAADGGVFSFGDAGFFGSTGSIRLNRPIVGMAATPDGGGYWLVAADGGVFTFGDAGFFGSAAADGLASPAVGLTSSLDGGGYWLVTTEGQIYAFGDATYSGSPGVPSFGIVDTAGGGYTVLTSGGADHFGPAASGATSPGPAKVPLPDQGSTPVRTIGVGDTAPSPTATGLTSTIGTATEPQIVRDGDVLRKVNPADPGQYLDSDFRFTGVDAYELSTDWAINVGCGSDMSDQEIDQLFSALGPNAVVRVWFFQELATNKYTGTRDWTGLDRVVDLADQYGVHIIATLANQDGTCDDGGWLDPSWYAGGYEATPPASSGRVSYQTYVAQVVQRYANNPAILAWEPVNEPRPEVCTDASDCWDSPACPDPDAARDDLKQFFDQIGAEIRSIDPSHLISDGAPPIGGCGTSTWSDFEYVDSSPGIDLMSFHDYGGGAPMSAADASEFTAVAAADDKPLFAGENGGLDASAIPNPSGSCPTEAVRAQTYQNQILGDFSQVPEFDGWLFWNAGPPSDAGPDPSVCNYETWVGDPLLQVLSTLGSGLGT
jgi:hypothetical protein